jgi:hypothetical protein
MQIPAGLKLNSLTFRLSILFAITAILLLASTGTFLYDFLERELMKRDHVELLNKVDLFRHRLAMVDTAAQIVAAPNLFRDIIIGNPHLRLALLDEQGNTLLSSTDWNPPPELLANSVMINVEPQYADMLMPTSTRNYHAIAAWGGPGRQQKKQSTDCVGTGYRRGAKPVGAI